MKVSLCPRQSHLGENLLYMNYVNTIKVNLGCYLLLKKEKPTIYAGSK